jgi:hypothetical protein
MAAKAELSTHIADKFRESNWTHLDIVQLRLRIIEENL